MVKDILSLFFRKPRSSSPESTRGPRAKEKPVGDEHPRHGSQAKAAAISWPTRKNPFVPGPLLLASYLILFFWISNMLLGELRNLPFMSDTWACINQWARPYVDQPSRVLLRGGEHPRWLHMYTMAKLFSIHGMQPESFHGFFLALHRVNCLLLVVFVALLTKSLMLGMAASFLFLFHPATLEAISWVCTGSNVWIGFFGVIMLICATQVLHPGKLGWAAVAVSAVAYLGACLSQENGVAMPLLYGLFFLTRGPRDRLWWRRGLINAACFIGMLVVFVIYLRLIRAQFFYNVPPVGATIAANWRAMVVWTFLPFLAPATMPFQAIALLFAFGLALVLLRKNATGLVLVLAVLLMILPVARVSVTVRSLYFNCMIASAVWAMILANWPEEQHPRATGLLLLALLAGLFLHQYEGWRDNWITGGLTTRRVMNLLTKRYPALDREKEDTVHLAGTRSFPTWYRQWEFQEFLVCLYGPERYPYGFYDPFAEDYRFFCALPRSVRQKRGNCFLWVEDGVVRDVTQEVRADPNLYFFYPQIEGGPKNDRGEVVLYGAGPAYVTFPHAALSTDTRQVWIVARMRGGTGEGLYSLAEVLLDGKALGRRTVTGRGLFSPVPEAERRDYVFPAILEDRDPHRIDIRMLNDVWNPEIKEGIDLFIYSIAVMVQAPSVPPRPGDARSP